MARPHKLTITASDAPLQTWTGLREDLETAETPADIREIYDDLLEYYRRPGNMPNYFSGPQSPEEAAWRPINAELRHLTEVQQALIVPVLDQTVRERPPSTL